MSLLCSLGWHRPGRTRWNRGYCFSRCRRCGRDLVRKDSGGWQVPKGYRVVWRSSGEMPSPPIDETSARPSDFMDDGWDSGRWADDLARRAAAAIPPPAAGDFMGDDRTSAPPLPQRAAARRSD